jgi:putative ABC transport system permease protein
MNFFFQHVLRYAMRHKILAVINVLSVALGISVFLAIRIVNESATKSFEAGVDIVAGRANLEARGAIDDTLLPELSKVPGVTAITPLVEGFVTLPDYPGQYLHLLGVDPLTNRQFKTFDIGGSDGLEMDRWFRDPTCVAVTNQFAAEHQLKIGDPIRAKIGERETILHVGFILNVEAGSSRYAAMDIGWAQELLGMSGKLTSVLFRIKDPQKPEIVLDQLSKSMPPNVMVQQPDQRSGQISKMLAGFQLNLTALSLISLLVGVFLIYNTITASVVRRRGEIGILRAIGASRQRVRWLFLSEALLYGLIGTVAGSAAGILLANMLVQAVSKTISNLYVLVSIDRFYLPIWQIPFVFLIGMGSVVLGAWIPANAGACLQPIEALSLGRLIERSRRPSPIWILYSGVGLVLAALFALIALNANRFGGFVSAFFTLAGFCLLSPHVTYGCGSCIGAVSHRFVLLYLASRNLVRSLYRHAMTVAALAAALAMLVGISIMIFSFRQCVDRWVNQRLVADLFISPAANEVVGLQYYVAPEFVQFLKSRPEVEAIDTYLSESVIANGEQVAMGVVIGSGRNVPEFVGGNDKEKYRRFLKHREVIVSEPLSRRLHVHDGDIVKIRTPDGDQLFRIAGTFYDYTKDAGIMLMQRENFERYWREAGINSVALYLRPGSDIKRVSEAIQREYPKANDYAINSNRDLRALVIEVFNQTFAVTNVLRIIALFVAVIGIVLNMIVLVKEREREIGTLRTIGVAPRQLSRMIILEALLIAVAALIIGVSAGCALSIVLTEVINRAFFGWTIPLRIPWDQLLSIPLWLLPVTGLAALFPARSAARARIVELLT